MVTPGQIDLRAAAARVLPDDLSGLRALDVGTFDGFWAFELERRGADVVAIDVDRLEAAEWPPLARAAARARGRASAGWSSARLRARRRGARLGGRAPDRAASTTSTADRIGGPVDLAFSGAILLHLRDPVRALERIRGALARRRRAAAAGAVLAPADAARPAPPGRRLSAPRSRASTGGCRTWPRSAAGCAPRACARSAGWRSCARRAGGRSATGRRRTLPAAEARSAAAVDRCYHRQGLAVSGPRRRKYAAFRPLSRGFFRPRTTVGLEIRWK